MDPSRALASESSGSQVQPTRILVVGGDSRAALLLGMLHGVGGVSVVGLLTGDASGSAARVADELGVSVSRDRSASVSESDVDLVMDASGGDPLLGEAVRAFGDSTEVLGDSACQLLLSSLAAHRLGDERQEVSGELEKAVELSRSQERRLTAAKTVLEAENSDLQAQLSEIFFAHEFFKAMARCASVDDVCSLAVDGLNGLLGSEVSCVYLRGNEGRTLHLRASQGRSHDVFRSVVPEGETILGSALAEGPVQESELPASSASSAWIDAAIGIRSHVAAPLVAGDDVVGVLVMGSTIDRHLSDAEMDRLIVLSNQVSLSLQNALLVGELERLAVSDRLTGLYDNSHFLKRLDEEFSRSSRFGHHLSLVLLDIDDLASLNEGHGQSRGDELLQGVSAVIRMSLREMDTAGRYGGEEFAILLPETDIEGASVVAERIRAGVESHAILVEGSTAVGRTVSAGVATFPEQAATATRLVEAATEALARAKKAGKNRVSVFEA